MKLIAYIAILCINGILLSNYTSKHFYDSIQNMTVEKQFNLWASFNNKDYASKEEERQSKYENFKENLKLFPTSGLALRQRPCCRLQAGRICEAL